MVVILIKSVRNKITVNSCGKHSTGQLQLLRGDKAEQKDIWIMKWSSMQS